MSKQEDVVFDVSFTQAENPDEISVNMNINGSKQDLLALLRKVASINEDVAEVIIEAGRRIYYDQEDRDFQE